MLCAYASIWSAGFVYEDWNGGGVSIMRPWGGWSQEYSKRPMGRQITGWSFRLLSPFTVQPWRYHAENLLLHFCAGLILAELLGVWISARLAALFTTGFWVHPLTVDAVAYVSGRSELLAGLWMLAAITSILVLARWKGIAACTLFGLLAFASKEVTAAALFGILPLALWAASVPMRRALLPLGAWGIGATYAAYYQATTAGWSYNVAGVWENTAAAWAILARVAVPIKLALDLPQYSQLAGVFAIGASVGLAWFAFQMRYRIPALWVAVAWCGLCFGTRILAPHLEPLHLHHAYVPLAGLAVALAVGVGQ